MTTEIPRNLSVSGAVRLVGITPHSASCPASFKDFFIPMSVFLKLTPTFTASTHTLSPTATKYRIGAETGQQKKKFSEFRRATR